MKFAIFFAFATFAFVAQANARSVAESQDRGVIVDALETKLTEAKEKLGKLLVKAQDVLKDKIAEARKQAEILIDQLKQKAIKISDDVYEAAQKILDHVGDFEDQVVEQAKKIGQKFVKN